jgi:uncharacterized membrane protein YhaH (DUF805 family)
MSTPNGPYDPYSPQNPGQQPPYGGEQQPPYGQQQPPYGQQQQQPSYGQPTYGQQQPYASYPGGPYGAPQPGYGAPYPPAGGPDGYLQGGPVGFGESISLALKNAFVYQGRASRSAYWWFVLFAAIIYLVIDVVALVAAGSSLGTRVALDLVFTVAWLIFGLALAVRRLHDIDRSGFWLFLGFVPFVGGIVLLVFSLLPGTRGPNRFG